MVQINSKEPIYIEIDSSNLFKQIKEFFEEKVQTGELVERKVNMPYYVGKGKYQTIKWFADKWYQSASGESLWEIKYPDFPASGFIRSFPDGKFAPKE